MSIGILFAPELRSMVIASGSVCIRPRPRPRWLTTMLAGCVLVAAGTSARAVESTDKSDGDALGLEAPAIDAIPDARRLAEGQTCYVISQLAGETLRPIGVTWQSVSRIVRDGRSILKVTVHQAGDGGAFDMKDEFELDGETLRPITLVNRRNGEVHVKVTYGSDRITGWRIDEGERSPINVELNGPVWDGNLFGLTFASLPLTEGAAFSLPYWQYDRGFGAFDVTVDGSTVVETPLGSRDAWRVTARAAQGGDLVYLIDKSDHGELGYEAGPGRQTLGGDCSALSGVSASPSKAEAN